MPFVIPAVTDSVVGHRRQPDRRLSFLGPLLPFINNRPLWEEIDAPVKRGEAIVETFDVDSLMMNETSMSGDEPSDQSLTPWVAGGPELFQPHYHPWQLDSPAFRCPSDPGIGRPSMERTNYAACLGDGIVGANTGPYRNENGLYVVDPVLAAQTEVSMRGMFVPRQRMRFGDTTDGLSSTLLLGEIAIGLGNGDIRTSALQGPGEETLRDHPDWAYGENRIDPERQHFWDVTTKHTNQNNSGRARGYRWADGMHLYTYTALNTILPPNSAIVLAGVSDEDGGVLSASSRHQGGANVCFGDGAVRFIADSIDAGDRSQPTIYRGGRSGAQQESPYGLWGALGTRSGQELVLAEDS